MKKLNYFALFLLTISIISCNTEKKEPFMDIAFDAYPNTQKVDQTDDYFGTQVADPYRWLEDDNADDTKSWVKAQNKVTFDYLNKIPFRNQIKSRLEKLWNYEKYSAPFKRGGKYYFYKNDGLQNQYVLYTQESLDSEPSVFLDPNTFSEDGTVSLAGFTVSKDGKYAAYQIQRSGSDWREIHVMEIDGMKKLADTISWVKFSGISWYQDGFYYSRYDEPKEGDALKGANQFQKVYYHKVGTTQAEDQLVYQDTEHAQRGFSVATSEDERFLMLYGWESTSGNTLMIKDLTNPKSDFITIIDDFDNDHGIIGNDGDQLYIITTLNAPNQRLVTVSASNPDPSNWKDVLPETENVLQGVNMVGGKLIADYMVDARSQVEQYDMTGKLEREIKLPTIGSASGFDGEKEDKEVFYTFTSFTFPSTIYRYNIESGESTLFRQSKVDFDPNDYETKQVKYKSKDGTEVPMFITHKKGLEMNGKNPTYLYSYGGFNVSLNPGFSVTRLLFMEMGGVFAMPNIRGGGEYGEKWHEAGTKMQKQNVFDDFIAAAEYLHQEKYTSPEFTAIAGGSNGGLLVGATMTQRPDICKVALPAVGVLDMLRYQHFTIGRAWATDYGTSEDSKEMFDYLYSYSPVHNVKKGTAYPATLVTTADHDDRVVPAHSFKFISALQENHDGPNPVMIRIEEKAGHGAGVPTSKRIQATADVYAFVFQNFGINPFDTKD
ncbi:MAG: prolyl oligopeptidase family serine peptidase [Flammeovirgaceae bacterium]